MANKHRERCLTSIVIKEMQIKMVMRYHSTMIRIAKTKKANNIKHFQGHVSTRIFIYS